MDLTILLSRLQFALTIGFHFLFVPLTIGLILMIAIYETKHYRSKDDKFRKISDYYTNIFIVNYAIGVVTGIAMSLQFGTNWGGYSSFMGDVFGTPLALEALIAFFLESTFTGILVFRRHRMSAKARMITAWLVFIGTSISSLWIITANGFMQNPVGFELAADGSQVILTSIFKLLTNPYAWYMLLHTVTAAYLLGSFFVLSVTSYRLLRFKKEEATDITSERQAEITEEKSIFESSVKTAAIVAVVTSLAMPAIGNFYFKFISLINPAKAALYLNDFDGYSEEVTALGGEPMGRLLATITNISFTTMIVLGTIFILISIYTLVYRKKFLESSTLQKFYVWLFLAPYVAILAGWAATEFGRQPWIVYKLKETATAASDVPASQVIFSILTIMMLNLILLVIVWKLAKNQVNKSLLDLKYYGPDEENKIAKDEEDKDEDAKEQEESSEELEEDRKKPTKNDELGE